MRATTFVPHARRLGNYAVTLAAGLGQILAAVYLSREAFHYFVEQDLKVWFLMLAAMPFLTLFELGATVVLPPRLAAAKHETDGVANIASNFIATVCMVVVGALGIAAPILWVCTLSDVLTPHAATLLAALAVGSAVRILANVMHSLLYAQGDNVFDKSLRVVSTLVMTGVIVSALHSGASLWAMPFGWTAAGLTSIIVCFIRQRGYWNVRLSVRYIRRCEVLKFLNTALRYVFIALPGQFVFNATPFVIASRLPAEYTVAFGLTQQMIAGIAIVVNLPVTIMAPRFAHMYQENRGKARDMLLGTLANVGIISAAALALVGTNVDTITSLWTGHEVAIGKTFLLLYFVTMFIEWQQTAATTAAMATGDLRFATVTVVSAILVQLGMPQLVDQFGFIGVPIALFAAQALTCHPHNFWKAFHAYGVRLDGYLKKLVLPAMVAVSILGAQVFASEVVIEGISKLILLSMIAATFSVFALYINLRSPKRS